MLSYDCLIFEPACNLSPYLRTPLQYLLIKALLHPLGWHLGFPLPPLLCLVVTICRRVPLPCGIQVGSSNAEPKGDWREEKRRPHGGFVCPFFQGHLGQMCSLD